MGIRPNGLVYHLIKIKKTPWRHDKGYHRRVKIQGWLSHILKAKKV